jgi:hypothetical protein
MKSGLRIICWAVMAMLFVQCSETSVNSVWNENQIQVDGVFSDWQSRLVRDEKSNVIIGVANDSENVYLCLTTSDQSLVRQVMRGGMIINLNLKAAKGRQFGIKFPMEMEMMPFRDGRERGSGRMDRSADEQNRFQTFRDTQTELILLGPGKGEMQIVPLMNSYNLKAALGQSQRQFVYELQIPFKLIGSQLGVKPPQPGLALEVTFETGKVEFAHDFNGGHRGNFEGGETPAGGMPGGPGGHGGGRGSGEMPGGRSLDKQALNYQIRVTLTGPQ